VYENRVLKDANERWMQKITRCEDPHKFYCETDVIGKGELDMEILETGNNLGRDSGYSQNASLEI
jgi:hypothetical protein